MKKKIATGILVGASITGIASSAVLAANTTSAIDDEVNTNVKQSVSTSSERSSRARSKRPDKDDSSISKTPAKAPKNHMNTAVTLDSYVFIHNRNGHYQTNLKPNTFQDYFIRGYAYHYYGYVTSVKPKEFTILVDLFKVDDKLYYADKNGQLLTGIQKIGDDFYYFGEDKTNAYARQGWVTLGNDSYYFGEDGKATKGFKKIGDFTFYFGKDGKRVHNLHISEDGSMYYFDGRNQGFGFKTIDGKKFYFNKENGGKAVKKDTIDIEGTMYEFDENGVCTGFYKILD